MICECGAKMKVVRTVSKMRASFRYYKCPKCGAKLNTEERYTEKAKELMSEERKRMYHDKKLLQNDIK